jgi:hypothetical protein
LDNWPETFDGVAVLKNIGAGVAPWNHIQYTLSRTENGKINVNSVPLVFYHFHSLTFVEPDIIIPSLYPTNPLTLDLLNHCFVPYVNSLHESINRVREIVPDYRFGLFRDQVLSEEHTFIAKRSQFERIKKAKFPHPKISLNDGLWDCYGSKQLRDLSNTNNQVSPNNAEGAHVHEQAASSYEDALSYSKSEFKIGNKQSAISVLRDVTKKWPGKYSAFMTLGEMLWVEGDQKGAVENLIRAYEIKPGEDSLVSKLINMLIQTDDYQTAQKIMTESLCRADSGQKAQSSPPDIK